MNNQFSQRVSDIITYSKEEANRLKIDISVRSIFYSACCETAEGKL